MSICRYVALAHIYPNSWTYDSVASLSPPLQSWIHLRRHIFHTIHLLKRATTYLRAITCRNRHRGEKLTTSTTTKCNHELWNPSSQCTRFIKEPWKVPQIFKTQQPEPTVTRPRIPCTVCKQPNMLVSSILPPLALQRMLTPYRWFFQQWAHP